MIDKRSCHLMPTGFFKGLSMPSTNQHDSSKRRTPVIAPRGEGWKPGPSVVDHMGKAPLDRDYFVMPPPEIGTILSAHSSLQNGSLPRGMLFRSLACVLGAAIGSGLGWLVGRLTGLEQMYAAIGVGLLGTVGVVVGWFLTRFKHTCTYVGREGVACYTCTGQRERITQNQVFNFQSAAVLRSENITHFSEVAFNKRHYMGNVYRYEWMDADGEVLFRIDGRFHSQHRRSSAMNKFQLACAAARVWEEYRAEHPRTSCGRHRSTEARDEEEITRQ
jgi:hypothetical protein